MILAAGTIGLVVFVKPQEARELVAAPPRVNPFGARVWPYLLAGFGMFTALGFVQILIGFLIQDRNGLSATATATATGGTLLAAGVGMLAAQAVIVPRVGWTSRRLMRAGTLTALTGLVLLLPDLGLPVFIAAVLLVGLGLGLAIPGYTAGPTLTVSRQEQGGLAGLLAANNALTFVLAPTAATALYSLSPILPLLAAIAILTLVAILLYSHPLLRATGAPTAKEPAKT